MSLTSLASGNVAPFRVFHTVCGKSCHPNLSEAVGKRRLKNLNYLFNFFFRFRIRAFQKLLGKEDWKTWNILFSFFFAFASEPFKLVEKENWKTWNISSKVFSFWRQRLSELVGKEDTKFLNIYSNFFSLLLFSFLHFSRTVCGTSCYPSLLGAGRQRRLKNLKFYSFEKGFNFKF